MNGFTSFVASVCLIAVGLLVGWVSSSAFGGNSWNALSAIGGWVGGLGAFYAAFVATKIAREQADRDTYKLYVVASELKGGMVFSDIRVGGNLVQERHSGDLVLEAFNSGLRPIQIVKLNYIHDEFGSGSRRLHEFHVEAGKSAKWVWSERDGAVFNGNETISIYSNLLLECCLTVTDAAGVVHEVHKDS